MEFACYTEWEQLPDSADALFARAERDSIFFSRPWLQESVSNALEEGHALALACVVERDRVLALLPLIDRDNRGNFQSLGHLYTSLYTVLLAEDGQAEVLKCLVLGLNQLPVYSLRLDPAAENDSKLHGLQQALESSGFTCHRHFRFYNWIHRLHGQSFEDYMAARPSRVRHTIARKQRKLEREHGFTIRLFTDEHLHQGLEDYQAVYKKSWKANELYESLIEDLVRSFSSRGWLRIAILYIEKTPVAAQFWFVAHGKASIFKLVHDDAWKQYSPGSILTRYLMKHVIETDRVEEIDFLTGNDTYKQDWMSERRQRWQHYYAKSRPAKGRVARTVSSLIAWVQRTQQTGGTEYR